MSQALMAELRKGRRRHDAAVILALALFVVLWAANMNMRTEDALASGYDALIYGLPIMHTVVMPLGMAVLASRRFDMETQGENCKLLFTLQEPDSLFFAKAAVLTAQNALLVGLELAGALLTGRAKGFTASPRAGDWAWLALGALAVNEMLLMLFFALSVRGRTQLPALGGGVIASLLGVFSAYMPEHFMLLMPWGWYVPLSPMRMDWDAQTRICTFIPAGRSVPLLLCAAALAMVFGALARRSIGRREM